MITYMIDVLIISDLIFISSIQEFQNKEKLLKHFQRERKDKRIKSTTYFATATWTVRRKWCNRDKALKENNNKFRILCLANAAFK